MQNKSVFVFVMILSICKAVFGQDFELKEMDKVVTSERDSIGNVETGDSVSSELGALKDEVSKVNEITEYNPPVLLDANTEAEFEVGVDSANEESTIVAQQGVRIPLVSGDGSADNGEDLNSLSSDNSLEVAAQEAELLKEILEEREEKVEDQERSKGNSFYIPEKN